MSTPKIKLYRLPTGYSAANDNDIQNATNDQLLPVKLKNVMPNQAYTLVGVSSKTSQVLVPIIHADSYYDCSLTNIDVQHNAVACVLIVSGSYYIDNNETTINGKKYIFGKYLVCNKPQMCPRFFYIKSNNGIFSRRYFTYGKDYIYVQNLNDYQDEVTSSQLKFVFGYNQSMQYWQIKQIGNNLVTQLGQFGSLYVCNLFLYDLQQCVCHFKVFDKSTTYYLTKSQKCQSSQMPNQFMPLLQDGVPNHLKPRIYYNSEYVVSESDSSSSSSNSTYNQTAYNVTLSQSNGHFKISYDYKLSGIISSFQSPQFNIPYNDVYNKTVTLVYYTIRRNTTMLSKVQDEQNTEQYIQDKSHEGYYNPNTGKFYKDRNFEQEMEERLGYVYVDKFNVYSYSQIDGFQHLNQSESDINLQQYNISRCYYNPFDGNCYKDAQYNYLINGSQEQRYVVYNNNYAWNFYIGFYRTHQTIQTVEFKKMLESKFKGTNIISPSLYYMAYSQKLYNGTTNSKKPNTLFLQYTKTCNFRNFNFTISTSMQKQISIKNYEKQLYDYVSSLTTRTTIQSKIYQYTSKNKAQYVYHGLSRGIINNHNRIDDGTPAVVLRGCKQSTYQYLLDTVKGIFYIEQYIKKNGYSLNDDYFFCDYYYQNSPTKLFVSDYQCWVTQHLRNNPDIFYGKKDYQGDDYIDANDNAIATGLIPCYLEDGYTIQYRNGAVSFGASRQDLNYTGGLQTSVSLSQDQATGVIKGGIARANFAYYAGLQNVIQQKLDYDPSYAGGGYKYKAINDKQYPDSINKRWVSRNNTSQFIGLSFTTKKVNAKGQISDYNLPDLQTTQLESLGQLGFQIGQDIPKENNQITRIKKKYQILTNQFSYPHCYKINNLNQIVVTQDDVRNKYVSNLTQMQLRQMHSSLKNLDKLSDKFSLGNGQNQFQHNQIQFKTLQNQILDTIYIDYCQVSTLPAIKVKLPVFTQQIKTQNLYRFKIQKGEDYTYSDFKLYIKAFKVDNYQDLNDLNNCEVGDYCVVLNKSTNQNLDSSKFYIYRYDGTSFVQKDINFKIDSAQSFAEKVCVFVQDINDGSSTIKQVIQKVQNGKQKTLQIECLVTKDLSYLRQKFNSVYFKFYKTSTLFRSYIEYDQNLVINKQSVYSIEKYNQIQYEQNSSSSSSSDSSSSYESAFLGLEYVIPNGYKQIRKNTNSLIFSISNLSQTTYFNFKVLDIFYMANNYNQTIVYLIKKNQSIQA